MAAHADASKFGSSSMPSSCLPLLVFHHHHPDGQEEEDGDDAEMLMFSISKRSLHENVEHGLLAAGNTMCWSTPQGWMMVLLLTHGHGTTSSSSSTCRLWNPSTGDKLPLPDLGEEHQIPYHCRCVLSHKDPTTHPGCVVVLFNKEAPDLLYCHTTGGGGGSSSRWRQYSYDIGNFSLPEPPKGKKARLRCRRRPIKRIIDMVASVQGKIYVADSTTGIVAMDFLSCASTIDHENHPTFKSLGVPLVDLPTGSRGFAVGRYWLVESRDQLFLVTVCFAGYDLKNIGTLDVHMMDFSSSTQACWRSVRDIGDVVFLLEDTGVAASCSASALGLKANQIFFMKNIVDDDADLWIFDLETNAQEITRVHPHDNLILWRKPFWIVPPS